MNEPGTETRLWVWRCPQHGLLGEWSIGSESRCLIGAGPGRSWCGRDCERIEVIPASQLAEAQAERDHWKGAVAHWQEIAERLESSLAETQEALRVLLDAFTRMPDAGLNVDDPRWGWWHNTAAARQIARAALSNTEATEAK